MPEQTRRNYTKARTAKEKDRAEAIAEKVKPKDKATVAEIDAMLDEIDEVLEENAEEMALTYEQHGGE